jgi:hypothetical protein
MPLKDAHPKTAMPYATVTWQWLKVWHGSNSCISRDSKYFYSQLIYANKRTLEGYFLQESWSWLPHLSNGTNGNNGKIYSNWYLIIANNIS